MFAVAKAITGSQAFQTTTRLGVDKILTIRLGVAASQMEKRGIRTERGNISRKIEVSNQHLRQLKARIVKLQTWLNEKMQNTEPPTLANYLQAIFERRAQEGKSSTSQSLYNIKDGAKLLNFITRNKITMYDKPKVICAMFGKGVST